MGNQAGGLARAGRVAGWLVFALFATSVAAQDEAVGTRLAPGDGLTSEMNVTVGEPFELSVLASRAGEPLVGVPLSWELETPGSGELMALDPRSRVGEDGIEAGSGRATFTAAVSGRHAIRVQAPVDPACAAADCPSETLRITLQAVPPAAPGASAGMRKDALWLAGGVAGLAAIASSAGGDDDANGGPTLAIFAGNGQSGLANTPLPVPLQVVALNGGQGAPGVTIQWSVAGGATLSATSSVTGPDNRAVVSVTSLGPGPGPVTVTATRADAPGASVTFTLVINIAALDKVSGDNQTTPVDSTTPAPLVVQTRLNGAPQAGVPVQWQVLGGAANLSGVQATSDANGFAQAFVDTGPLAGPVTVLVARTDSPALSQSFSVDVVELRDLAIVGGSGQSGAQDTALPLPLVVLATDGGAGDPGVTIFWSATGGAQLSAGSTVTDGAGNASVTVTNLGLGLAPVTVTAQRADQPGLSVDFTFNVVPPTLTVIAGNGQSGLSGSPAATPLQVQLLNGDGVPLAGQTVSWSVMSGSATLLSPISVTDGAGNASVSFSYGNVPGPVSIRASAFANGVFVNANATGVAPGGMAPASGDGQTGDPGDALPLPLVVQLVDPAPDLSGVPISFVVVSGSATLAPATAITDTGGQASTLVTLGLTPGPVLIQATAPGGVVTQFTATVTGTLVVTGISASSGNAQQLTPGVASAPMVVELIGNGVPVVGQTVTWSTTGGTLASATTVTDANGQASNTVTVSGAGTTVVTASFPSFAEFVGSSINFTHNAGLAALPALSVNEASVAEALDAACALLQVSAGLDPGEQDLLEQCLALTAASTSDPDAVGDALTAMLPDVAQAQSDAGRAAVGAQFENLNSRMVGLRSGAPMAQFSLAGVNLTLAGGRLPMGQLGMAMLGVGEVPAPNDESALHRWGFFVSGNIGRGESDPNLLTPRFDFDVEGITAGTDYRWSDSLVLGVALGYTRQDTVLAGGQGSVDMDGFSLSGYATWYRDSAWYMDSVLTLASNSYDHVRSIQYVLPGSTVDQRALASSDGSDLSTTITFGRDFNAGAWMWGVYGRAAYSRLGFDSFEEQIDESLNGNGLALRVESRTVTGMSSTLGGKVSFAYSASWGVLVPQLEAEWVREYGGDSEAFRGYFVDDPTATPVRVLGEDLDSDYFRVGLGMSMVLTHGRSGFFVYERTVARTGLSQQGLSIGFRWEF